MESKDINTNPPSFCQKLFNLAGSLGRHGRKHTILGDSSPVPGTVGTTRPSEGDIGHPQAHEVVEPGEGGSQVKVEAEPGNGSGMVAPVTSMNVYEVKITSGPVLEIGARERDLSSSVEKKEMGLPKSRILPLEELGLETDGANLTKIQTRAKGKVVNTTEVRSQDKGPLKPSKDTDEVRVIVAEVPDKKDSDMRSETRSQATGPSQIVRKKDEAQEKDKGVASEKPRISTTEGRDAADPKHGVDTRSTEFIKRKRKKLSVRTLRSSN